MRELFNPLIKTCGTLTDPAAETKSIGLPADALVPCFLLSSREFYRDTKLSSTYRDWQKTRHPDTDAN
jgi:hypothetical protein